MKKTIYLIRHSIKEKMYGDNESNDSNQVKDEKRILSIDGEKLALKLSQLEELKNVEEVWCSNYVRTIQTAKYIANNRTKINISNALMKDIMEILTKVLIRKNFGSINLKMKI